MPLEKACALRPSNERFLRDCGDCYCENKDLQKALSSYVELFGTKTWWSTKDNQKINSKETRTKTKHRPIQKHIEEEEESDCMSTTSDLDNNSYNSYSESSTSTYSKKDQKQKDRKKEEKQTTHARSTAREADYISPTTVS